MRISQRLIWHLVLVVTLATMTSPVQSSSVGQKAALQAAMQQHIDRSLVNGAFLHLDTNSGQVRQLYPLSPHPMILRMGDYFVLCSDFKDGAGESVNVDFYIARDAESYVIFHSAVDDRDFLKRWLSEGVVKPFE